MDRHHPSSRWLREEEMEPCLDQNVVQALVESSVTTALLAHIRMTILLENAYLAKISPITLSILVLLSRVPCVSMNAHQIL